MSRARLIAFAFDGMTSARRYGRREPSQVSSKEEKYERGRVLRPLDHKTLDEKTRAKNEERQVSVASNTAN